MPSSLDLARLLQSTLVELESSEELQNSPEAAAELRSSILRTIAELEITRHERVAASEPVEIAGTADAPEKPNPKFGSAA